MIAVNAWRPLHFHNVLTGMSTRLRFSSLCRRACLYSYDPYNECPLTNERICVFDLHARMVVFGCCFKQRAVRFLEGGDDHV